MSWNRALPAIERYRAGPLATLVAAGSSLLSACSPLLQVLPLVLEMGWQPPNPQRALELLTLTVSPVPRMIARHLAEALQNWPADWVPRFTFSISIWIVCGI